MWFSAKLLFRCVINGSASRQVPAGEEPLGYEETIILLHSENEEAAKEEALRLAKEMKHSYKNVYGEDVSWQFQKLLDLCEITGDEIKHGTEVYYRFLAKPPDDGG